MAEYMKAEDLNGKPLTVQIKSIEKEVVDGVPRLVLYFNGEERGLLLTRQLADDITAALGRSKIVDEFFGLN
jgi:hypothetical protein